MFLRFGYWACAFQVYYSALCAFLSWQAGAHGPSTAFAAFGVLHLAGGVGLRNYMRKERA